MRWAENPRELARWNQAWKVLAAIFVLLATTWLVSGKDPLLDLGFYLPKVPSPLVMLTMLALAWTFQAVRPSEQVAKRLVGAKSAQGFIVRVSIVQDGIITGSDTGALNAVDDLLVYEGLRASFSIGSADVEERPDRDRKYGGVALALNEEAPVYVVFTSLENPPEVEGAYALSDYIDDWWKSTQVKGSTGTSVPLEYQEELNPSAIFYVYGMSVALLAPLFVFVCITWFKLHWIAGIVVLLALTAVAKLFFIDQGRVDFGEYKKARSLYLRLRRHSTG